MKMVIPMRGRMMHSVDGQLTFQPYSKDEKQAIYSSTYHAITILTIPVSRGDLNCKLMSLAEQRENITIHFDMKCNELNFRTNEVTVENEGTTNNSLYAQPNL